jgi:hypothetical protein
MEISLLILLIVVGILLIIVLLIAITKTPKRKRNTQSINNIGRALSYYDIGKKVISEKKMAQQTQLNNSSREVEVNSSLESVDTAEERATEEYMVVKSEERAVIDKKELQECLVYFEAETKVIAFQSKEADLFNSAMVEYGNSIMENPLAAKKMKISTNRLAQSATEVLRRHEEIKNIPFSASAMRSAWHVAFLVNASWASAMVEAIESNIFAFLKQSEGMNPEIGYAQQLTLEFKKAWRKADEESKKLLKKLKVSAEDIEEIMARATTAATSDTWEPKLDE